jgi:hypothetical protein
MEDIVVAWQDYGAMFSGAELERGNRWTADGDAG